MSENILSHPDAKVVYAALRRMSEDRTVIQQAFQHWMTGLYGQPFDVVETVSSIEKFLGLSTQERKVLMISMHAAANRAAHEVPEVPDYILRGASSSMQPSNDAGAAPKVSAKSPVVELTQAYFGLVLKGALRANASGYRELVSVLEDEGIAGVGADINRAIKDTVVSGLDLPKSADQTVCQNLCHDFYNLVAEIMGPMDADVVSNNAISATLDMEAATRFDPRELL